MMRDRAPVIGAWLAIAVLVLLVVIDLSVAPEYAVLTPLFALAPLIACAVVPVAGTAAIGTAAVVAAYASGFWNEGTAGTGQQNVRLLNVILVSAAAIAIAAVRVHRERRFEEVSAMAEAAQRAILPVVPARLGGVAVATRYRSAAHGALVGGDLYDCYHSESRVRFLIGDVRGKGITGVEQAARVIRAFRQAAALRESLSEVAREMDDYLADFFGDEEFVTALLVEVSGPGRLELLNAGHPPPQLVRASGESELIDLVPALPLGLARGAAPGDAGTRDWAPGDRRRL
jgi:serine phosphatase RsbU (regulator of sigma subunit)